MGDDGYDSRSMGGGTSQRGVNGSRGMIKLPDISVQ